MNLNGPNTIANRPEMEQQQQQLAILKVFSSHFRFVSGFFQRAKRRRGTFNVTFTKPFKESTEWRNGENVRTARKTLLVPLCVRSFVCQKANQHCKWICALEIYFRYGITQKRSDKTRRDMLMEGRRNKNSRISRCSPYRKRCFIIQWGNGEWSARNEPRRNDDRPAEC